MVQSSQPRISLRSVRPLVRYVDCEQAVIDTIFSVNNADVVGQDPVDLHIRLTGPSGRVITHQSSVHLRDSVGMVRFEVGEPRRWWPATLGDQELYQYCITLLVGDEAVGSWSTTLGMTSVRVDEARSLLVNGREYEVSSVVSIEPDDENSVLPVAGDSLLLVQDHFGPDVLYDAADRAGLLLIQSVPVPTKRKADINVCDQVDRLVAHPSLAGWLVDQVGQFGDRIADRLHDLDPTRSVFRELSLTS